MAAAARSAGCSASTAPGRRRAQTRRGAPLHPWTLPNLVGYLRLAAIPVFLRARLRSSDDGRDPAAALLYLGITLGDYLDGFLARATGQYSRMGALLDPVVDRLTVLAGAAVCWHFELLPRWALAVLAVREVVTLVLAQMALRRGLDIEVNWIGRIGVFLVFGGIFWSMVVDWWIIRAGFVVGVAIAVAGDLRLRARGARTRAARRRATVKLNLKFADRPYNRPAGIRASRRSRRRRGDEHRLRRDFPDIGSMSDRGAQGPDQRAHRRGARGLLPPPRAARARSTSCAPSWSTG